MKPSTIGPAEEAKAPRRAFGALRHRDFRLFWGGAVISHFGVWMEVVARAWLIYELTGSALYVGLLGLFRTVPFVITSFWAGTVIDRVDRRRLLILMDSLHVATFLVFAILIQTGRVELWHIYATTVVHNVVGSFESPARASFLAALVPRRDLATAISLNSVVTRGSQIIGPALGGLAIAAFGVAGSYFVTAATYTMLPVSLFLIRAIDTERATPGSSPWETMLDGFRYVRGHGVIRALLLMEAAFGLLGNYTAMMVVFAREIFVLGPEGLGLLQSASGAGSLLATFVLGSVGDVRHKGRLLTLSGAAYGLALGCFALTSWLPMAAALLVLVGAADMLAGALRLTMIQLAVRGELRGRVMSLHSVAQRGLSPLGGLQLGALSTVIGIQWAVATGGLLCLAVALGVSWAVRGVRTFVGTGADDEDEESEKQRPPARRAVQEYPEQTV